MAGLAEFQFTDDSALVLESVNSVTVCLELISEASNLERDVLVSISTEDGTAEGTSWSI